MRSTKGEEPPGVRAELKQPLTPPPRPTGTGPSACHRATGPLRGGAGMAAGANRSASGAVGGVSEEGPSPRPPSRPRADSPPAAATISLSVERRGFARRPARGPEERCQEVRLASPRGSRPEEQEKVPRSSRLKRRREHHPTWCWAAVTFNPLRAERRHVTGRAGAVCGPGRVGPAAQQNVPRWPGSCPCWAALKSWRGQIRPSCSKM